MATATNRKRIRRRLFVVLCMVVGIIFFCVLDLNAVAFMSRAIQRTTTSDDSYDTHIIPRITPKPQQKPQPSLFPYDYHYYDSRNPMTMQTMHHQRRPLSVPQKVLQQYMEWHGVEALRRENPSHSNNSNNNNSSNIDHRRRYAVAAYWCPDQAGNILHNLYNNIAWAIITNRTLLLQWVDDPVYHNKESECQAILQRQSWVPVWDEWKDKLQLPEPKPIALSPSKVSTDAQIDVARFPHCYSILKNAKRRTISRAQWRHDPLSRFGDYLDVLPPPQKRIADQIYQEGTDYLFGMFFREVFTLLPHVGTTSAASGSLPTIPSPLDYDDDNNKNNDKKQPVFTLAVHSRHTAEMDRGDFVNYEVDCLAKLLPPNRTSETCRVYILSDRQETLDRISAWVRNHQCLPVSQQHDLRHSATTEHGPFAGAGFFFDLAMGSQARSALVGDFTRSSTRLLKEIVVYDRRVLAAATRDNDDDDDDDNDNDAPPPLLQCSLPLRKRWGYDYGQGTPRFGTRASVGKLAERMGLEDYKKRHDQEALTQWFSKSNRGERGFAVATWNCNHVATDYQKPLHILMWAMLANRTLLWKQEEEEEGRRQDGESCSVQSWMPQWKEWASKLQLDSALLADVSDTLFDAGAFDKLATSRSIETMQSQYPKIDVKRAEQLFQFGPTVARGILFENIYEIPRVVRHLFKARGKGNTTETASKVTIAVDARRHGNDGDATAILAKQRVDSCLEKVLALTINTTMVAGNSSQSNCSVVLFADQTGAGLKRRDEIRSLIQNKYNCDVREPRKKEDKQTSLSFWKGLLLASQVKNGWVGMQPSPILDRIDQSRFSQRGSVRLPPFARCDLATLEASLWTENLLDSGAWQIGSQETPTIVK